MNLKIEIGLASNGEWSESVVVPLISYDAIFKSKYPGMLVDDSFSKQMSVENHQIDLADNVRIEVTCHFHSSQNVVLIFAKYMGKVFTQVHAVAFDGNDNGINIVCVSPGTDIPISITLAR